MTSGSPAWKYIYDALDRLVEVRQNGTLIARYAYDVLGRRIVKRVYVGADSGYVRMIYRGGEVIAEADFNGTLTFGYTRGLETDNLIAIRRYSDGSHYYVVHDPLGSVRGLSRRDGTWIASWRYDAYGAVIDSAGSAPFPVRYRWTGREYDAETGLYSFRSRMYDPAAQRFVQEDKIGFAGGANLYAYGDGNPTNGRDPDGMSKSQLFYDIEASKARTLALTQMGNPGGFTCYVDGVAAGGGLCGALINLFFDGGLKYIMEKIIIFATFDPKDILTLCERDAARCIPHVEVTLPDPAQLAEIPVGIDTPPDPRCPGIPNANCDPLLGGIRSLTSHSDQSCRFFGGRASARLAAGNLRFSTRSPFRLNPNGTIEITYGYHYEGTQLVFLTSAAFSFGVVPRTIAHEESHVMFGESDVVAGYYGSLCG